MRRVVAMLLVTLAAGFLDPATCGGWESSARGRMACCARSQHAHRNEQQAADDCCAGREQSRSQSPTAGIPMADGGHAPAASVPAPYACSAPL